ncbi:MAG: YMGG-like glycine zipper-containing protein [Bacteroidota bacterium]
MKSMKTIVSPSGSLLLAVSLSLLALSVSPAVGQQKVPPNTNPANQAIYPAGGQSAEQQQKDQLECYQWATQQTGWDPYVAYDQLVEKGYAAKKTEEQAQGGLVRGAAKGALLGVTIGAIAGDAGKGAAIGAAAGGLTGGMRSRRARKSAEAEAQAATDDFNKRFQEWDRFYTSCMTGRNYTVN